MLELVSISRAGEQWYLNKVIVNPNHISSISEDRNMNSLLKEGKIELGFNSAVSFSKVEMDKGSGFSEFVVIGSPTEILEKINKNKNKQLLKG